MEISMEEVKKAIREAQLDQYDELVEVAEVVRERTLTLARLRFSPGDILEFEHKGLTIRGVVASVNEKSLTLSNLVGKTSLGQTQKFAKYRVEFDCVTRVGELFELA